MAVKIVSISLDIKTISALSIAISVPLPIAIPTSAWASAGESFTPSPTITTFLPCSCKSLTFLYLSSGETSAITSSIPNFLAITFAVLSLSPVSI